MVNSPRGNLKGRYVTFLVRDIHHPQPIEVLHELHDNEQLRGKVLDLSHDAREEGGEFVVVKVPHLRDLCIVSVDSLTGIWGPARLRRGRDD